MITISIPRDNHAERGYVIDVVFSCMLGLPYSLLPGKDATGYHIYFDGAELFFKDCFFGRFPGPLSYLTREAIPANVTYLKNRFMTEQNLPVIYGCDDLVFEDKKMTCGIDLFGSVFFMLTRWEEIAHQVRDFHDRFPAKESLAFRGGFLNRPVVNEYVEMLWNMMVHLGYRGERKFRAFKLVLTHDVDHLDYPATGRILLGDLLKYRNIHLARRHFLRYLQTGSNPFDYFDFLMSRSEKLGLQSRFYFLASQSGLPYDCRFYLDQERFRDLVARICRRGHLIGFHPGYYTYNDEARWQAEKSRLEQTLGCTVTEGRQHYLRFDVAQTFMIWENQGMETDSSLCYVDLEGFRCGTGDTFPVFDCMGRKQLRLRERPLIIMDGTLKKFREYDPETMVDCFRVYLQLARKYRMMLTLLFHNSFYGEWEGYDVVYGNMLDTCGQGG